MIRYLEKQEEYQIYSKRLYLRIKDWFQTESEIWFEEAIVQKYDISIHSGATCDEMYYFQEFHHTVRLQVMFYDKRQSICFLASLGSDMSYFSDQEKILSIKDFRDDLENMNLHKDWIYKIITLLEEQLK